MHASRRSLRRSRTSQPRALWTATALCRAACEGQLWGPALLLARQLGDSAFADVAAAMAAAVGPPGCPLRTLALVLAGRPDAALPPPHALSAGSFPTSAPDGLPPAPSPDGPRSTGSGSALSLFGLGRARQGPDPDPSNGGAPTSAPSSGQADEAAASAVLDDWRRNLAALAANRSPGDEVLLVRLGDRLWQERGLVRPCR